MSFQRLYAAESGYNETYSVHLSSGPYP